MSFKKEFNRVQAAMYRNSARKGFHDVDKIIDEQLHQRYGVPQIYVDSIKQARAAQRLMLIVSELSEALESMRHGNPPDSHIPKFTGLEAELADAVIRIQDLAGTYDLRLAEAIVAKASYNARRPKMHRGKKF